MDPLHRRQNANSDSQEHLTERRRSLRLDLPQQTYSPAHQTDRAQLSRRPLIDQVTNQWRDEKNVTVTEGELESELFSCDLEDENSCPNISYRLLIARRFRRAAIWIAILTLATYFLSAHFIWPKVERELDLSEGFRLQNNGTYGIARGGKDKSMIQIETLGADLIPGGVSDPNGKRRLVFVGDVHGCKNELRQLLDEVSFNEESDHLVLVGDVLSKGPDNVGTLDELIRLNATSVRGNHEDRILTAAKMNAHSETSTVSVEASSKAAKKDDALLRQLKPHHLAYLKNMPLILRIPPLPRANSASKKTNSPIAEEILVAHAGLVPGTPLERQDPYFVMNMRSINHRTHVPSATRSGKEGGGKPWIEIWNWYCNRLFHKQPVKKWPSESSASPSSLWTWAKDAWSTFSQAPTALPPPQVVIYGHDSKAGLRIERWTKGLDSGCVSGGRLTALVLDARGEQKYVSVGCKNYRD